MNSTRFNQISETRVASVKRGTNELVAVQTVSNIDIPLRVILRLA